MKTPDENIDSRVKCFSKQWLAGLDDEGRAEADLLSLIEDAVKNAVSKERVRVQVLVSAASSVCTKFEDGFGVKDREYLPLKRALNALDTDLSTGINEGC